MIPRSVTITDACLSMDRYGKRKSILNDVNVFPIERVESGAVLKFVINYVTNAQRAHFAP